MPQRRSEGLNQGDFLQACQPPANSGKFPAMIDTLKLSKKLHQAGMPSSQAEALANGLAESLKETMVTKEFLQVEVEKLRTEIARMRGELIFWVVGTVGLGTILSHYWK